ncbi:MAG: spore germination protein [Lachnotalea sp.]
MILSRDIVENTEKLKQIFPINKSFDIITKKLLIGNTKAFWIGINGFCNNDILLHLISELQFQTFDTDTILEDINVFVASYIGYIQAKTSSDFDELSKNLLSGSSFLIVDGFDTAIIIDARSYPMRGIQEPDAEKVMRGAKDGFIETLVSNTALIRRRIRNPDLTFELKSVGSDSQTDVVLAYVDGMVDHELLTKLKDKIDSLDVSALTMGAKSLEELLIKKKWYTPLPQTRYTERPDVACSFLLEGYIVIIVDNSPTALVFPCTLFQFTQHPDDYYQNPLIGNYLRFLRFACILASLFVMPIFLLLGGYVHNLPSWLRVITTGEVTPWKLFTYVIVIEVGLDIFKYSSATAASGYSHSLGLIGGLLIGNMAVDLKWLNLESLFYGAATLLANVSISSQEFSDAIRIYRLSLVILTGFFGIPGFVIGVILIILSMSMTKSFGDKSYLWPLIPFKWSALSKILFRYPTPKVQEKKYKN